MNNQALLKMRPYAINTLKIVKQFIVIGSLLTTYMLLFTVLYYENMTTTFTLGSMFPKRFEIFSKFPQVNAVLTIMCILPCIMLVGAIISFALFFALRKNANALKLSNNIFIATNAIFNILLLILSIFTLIKLNQAIAATIQGTEIFNVFIVNFVLIASYFYLGKMENKHIYFCDSPIKGAIKINVKSYVIETLAFIALIVGALSLLVPVISMLGENAFDITLITNMLAKNIESEASYFADYCAVGIAGVLIILMLIYSIGYQCSSQVSAKRAIIFTAIAVALNVAFCMFCMGVRDAAKMEAGLLVKTKAYIPLIINCIILSVQLILTTKPKLPRVAANNINGATNSGDSSNL